MRGSIDDRARDRRALLLAARQRDAALADHRVVALRESRRRPCRAAPPPPRLRSRCAAHRRQCAGRACPPARPARPGRTRRCRRACPRTGTAPAARSRSRRAGSPAECRARRRRRRRPCPAADRAAAASRLTSVDLPEPVGADDRDRLARLDAWRTRGRRTGALAVGERRDRGTRSRRGSPRAPAPACRARVRRPIASAIAGSRVEHLEHPLPRRHAALQHVRHPAERDHRPAEHRQVGVERDELAERDAAADHLAAAEPEHEQRAEAEEEATCSGRRSPAARSAAGCAAGTPRSAARNRSISAASCR